MTNRTISRRALLRASAGSLLAAGLWPGSLFAQDSGGQNFTFLCVNDLHYHDQRCVPFFEMTLKKMKEAAPDANLLLVVGDLCENGTTAETGGIRDILKASGLTVKVVPGNHDWTSQTERKPWEELWPNSLNYTFDQGGWQFVGLDSSDGVKWQNTNILPPTLGWLDQNLPKLDKTRPMVLYTHFPLGPNVQNRVLNGDQVLDRFKEYNLRGVFNGHYHAYTERTRGDLLITTNRCCAYRKDNHDNTREKGFVVCRTRDGKVTREFVVVSTERAPQA